MECCLWETKPLPLQKYFAEQVGYGRGCPYNCAHRPEPAPKAQPEDYANAVALLDSSLVLGSHSYPIIAQSMEVMEHYVKAIKKVFANIKNLF